VRRKLGYVALGLLAIVVVLAAQGQSKKDLKAAAKKAIDAFFQSDPGRTAAAGTARLLATISDKRIAESSGLTASRTTSGVLWTHNDSGSGPHLFAIDRQGRTLCRYDVSEAKNNDWEDIAIGPGADGKPALYIGDIGDNNKSRSNPIVYRVREPVVATNQTRLKADTLPAEKLPFRYPDGAHDAETLMVHPKTGEIFIVTKSGKGVSGVYAFPLPLQPGQKVTLTKVATLTFTSHFGSGRIAEAERMTTGGDISPDGRRVAIRTYVSAYEWDIAPNQSVGDALKGKPRTIFLPLTRQGESLCYRADGKALLMTSEASPSPLYELPLK
jgi:hypothetical protein